jgi:enoyl-CoA hydratase/carnithine racemase
MVSAGQYEDIVYEKEAGRNVARITLNRPDRLNAFRRHTFLELIEAYEDAASDPVMGVIVTTGAGRAFSTGGDLKEFASIPEGKSAPHQEAGIRLTCLMRSIPKPIIAAVNGPCYGFGNEYLLACDLAIASEDAVICQPELRVGSSPVNWVTQLFPILIGDKRAKEFVFLRRELSAKEAQSLGIVNKVVPKDKLEDEVNEWIKIILEGSPQAIKFAKTTMNAYSNLLYPVVELSIRAWGLMHKTEEFREGMKAAVEKRKPDYSRFRK